ncbi:MAG: acyltransferase family protein [Vulcanimicrobiaceae bacterium]
MLDGLRGLAISLVVWYHAWLVSGFSVGVVNFMAEAGFLGVDLFFFISGFCLFYPYARARYNGLPMPATRRFFMRRAAKIVPSYLLALTIFAAVYRDRFVSPQDAAVQIASHLSFFHTLNPATFGGISGPLWTVGIEAQFYFVFPLVCAAFSRSPFVTYLGMLAIGEGYRFGIAAAHLDSTFWAFNQLPAYLGIFGAGMLAAHLVVGLRHKATAQDREWFTLVAFGALVLAIAGLAQVTNIYRNAGIEACYAWVNAHRVAFGPLCLVIGVASTLAIRPWRAIVGMRPLVFLSVISYNLYLWNLEIVFWLRSAGLSPAESFWLSIPASLAVATAVTYVLERPILQASAPRAMAPAAATRPAAVPVRSR